MKKYKIILFFICFVLMFSSCEDFLDRHPSHEVVSEAFWVHEQDAMMGLMGIYSRLYWEPFNERRHTSDMLTDISRSEPQLQGAVYSDIAEGILQSTTGGPVSGWYAASYRGITTANIFLENIDRIEGLTPEARNRYIAEARFLRAWFYFTLQQTYGGVIIYDEVPTVEGSKIKQSTSEEVLNFILQDLNFAIPNLPNTSYTGRIVKNTAHAFKAKVLLFTEQWAAAAAEAATVMVSGQTSLYDNYRDLFINTGQAGNPDEILFSTQYKLPDRWHRSGNERLAYATSRPRMELAKAYLSIDGLPTNESPLFDPDDPWSNRDPRLLQTLNVTGTRVIDGTTFEYNSATGVFWNKYIEDHMSYLQRQYHLDDMDIIHLRYADVLLIYAEAQNEAVGPDQSVYSAINEIRDRVGMAHVAEGLSKDEMREVIRLERKVELAGEGHRWFDLKRWGIYSEVMQAIDEPGMGTGVLNIPEHQLLWPFPQTEIDINPNLVQNPEY